MCVCVCVCVCVQVLVFWRKYERVEKEQRRRAEREAQEQRRHDEEMREARRQQRKLNFLITQTELYAHFMAKKLTGEEDSSQRILQKLEDTPLQREVVPGVMVNLEDPEEYGAKGQVGVVCSAVRCGVIRVLCVCRL